MWKIPDLAIVVRVNRFHWSEALSDAVNHIVRVRLSDEKLQALLNYAEEQGVNISKAIRMMIAMIPQVDGDMFKQALDRHTAGK